jgi:putative GTP pyrophosphokinase
MTAPSLSTEHEEEIDRLVALYAEDRDEHYKMFLGALRGLVELHPLADYVHSWKARLKEPEHLRNKLRRKRTKTLAGEGVWDITLENLFEKINDLAGVRIIHLYGRQMEHVDRHLVEALNELQLPLLDRFARTWDDENRKYFRDLGITTEDSDSMYTSVHYVVRANTRSKRTGEIQVRTLAEELWGEVDHTINYPERSPKVTCREQIRVLARATSTCTRLVDSIFLAHNDNAST